MQACTYPTEGKAEVIGAIHLQGIFHYWILEKGARQYCHRHECLHKIAPNHFAVPSHLSPSRDNNKPKMLCRHCRTSISDAFSRSKAEYLEQQYYQRPLFIIHDSLDDFHTSTLAGCFICRQIWMVMSGHESHFELDDQFLHRWKLQNSLIQFRAGTSVKEPYLYISIQESSLGFTFIPVSEEARSHRTPTETDLGIGGTSTAGTAELWSTWLHTCSTTHSECRTLELKLQAFTPDRLIEISRNGDTDSFSWRLVLRQDVGNVQYVTLSHCWGSRKPTQLTKKNYPDFLNGSTASMLPKTFKHAFIITASLGFRHIWIDSLCIVQDDTSDWEAQSSMMGSIYRSSQCNIAATWAEHCGRGCFARRDPFTTAAPTVTLDYQAARTTNYQLVTTNAYCDDVVEAPLNTRGWVVQERYLARRQLHFTQSQVYWECQEHAASEQFPAGMPVHLVDLNPYDQMPLPDGKTSLDFEDARNLYEAWSGLVSHYSGCDFSRSTDRMIALAGLAGNFQNATNDIYLAGLWRKDLLQQLCWYPDENVRRAYNRSRTTTYMAPSWSWASIDAPVVCDDSASYPENFQLVFCTDVLDVSVYSVDPSKLHSFVSGKLILRGIALQSHTRPIGNGEQQEVMFSVGFPGSYTAQHIKAKLAVAWDENLSSFEVDPRRWLSLQAERSSNLLFMLLHVDARVPELADTIRGLVLREMHSSTGESRYVRLGTFFDNGGGFVDLLTARLECQTAGLASVHNLLDSPRIADLVHTVTVI